MKAAIVVTSTSRYAGEAEDLAGPALAEFARSLGCEIETIDTVPDDVGAIEAALRHFSDNLACRLILTTGGTGFSPDDVTPEATRNVIDKHAPGIGEAMRYASREHTDKWMLSRGIAGVRRGCLIVNFPGSPNSIQEAGEAVAAALPHALELLASQPTSH